MFIEGSGANLGLLLDADGALGGSVACGYLIGVIDLIWTAVRKTKQSCRQWTTIRRRFDCLSPAVVGTDALSLGHTDPEPPTMRAAQQPVQELQRPTAARVSLDSNLDYSGSSYDSVKPR